MYILQPCSHRKKKISWLRFWNSNQRHIESWEYSRSRASSVQQDIELWDTFFFNLLWHWKLDWTLRSLTYSPCQPIHLGTMPSFNEIGTKKYENSNRNRNWRVCSVDCGYTYVLWAKIGRNSIVSFKHHRGGHHM